MTSFPERVVIVTGAGSGIGKATAIAFAQAGGRVVVSDIQIPAGEATVELIRQGGGEAVFLRCDVTRPSDLDALVREAVTRYGRLDIAINNAGIGGAFARLTDQTAEDFDQMMAVNVGGVFYGMQAEIRQMLTQPEGGCIVNVSSIAGVRGMPMGGPYSASKHAVIGLTKTAALEYARQGIRINAVCPVYTESGMVQRLIDTAPGIEEKMRRVIPMGRFGRPEEIAQAVLWLCAPENAFCTGQAIQLDGGLTAG